MKCSFILSFLVSRRIYLSKETKDCSFTIFTVSFVLPTSTLGIFVISLGTSGTPECFARDIARIYPTRLSANFSTVPVVPKRRVVPVNAVNLKQKKDINTPLELDTLLLALTKYNEKSVGSHGLTLPNPYQNHLLEARKIQAEH